ncbi:MAG: CoA ester lyase [Desulfomicrobium sp.]
MAVMRSWLFVAGHDKTGLDAALPMKADVLVLDLEDLVPPAEKPKARTMVRENLAHAASAGAEVWVRVNAWETGMTDEDIDAVVYPGLNGVNLTKVAGKQDVLRLAKRLDVLERDRGIEPGSIKICLLVETAIGIANADESCAAHERVVAAIFGAVDYTRDMQVKLTPEGAEQLYARSRLGVAARAARILPIDAPFLDYTNASGYEKNINEGKQLGFKGRMIVHPDLVPAANRLYAPTDDDVKWAKKVISEFEANALAKGKAAIVVDGGLVDTPVYYNAQDIMANYKEVCTKN